MSDSNFGLGGLQVGKRVKVKGSLSDDGTFQAIEINLEADTKASVDEISIEGLIQSTNHEKRTLRLLNREVTLPDGIEVKDSQSNAIDLRDLKAGDTAKVKGKYWNGVGFMPEKIKKKENKGFDIDELQGVISKIDSEKKTFDLAGITILNVSVPEKSKSKNDVSDYYDNFLQKLSKDKDRPNQRHISIYRLIKEWSDENCKSALDLGCGIGLTTDFLSNLGIEAVGIDISPKLLEFSKLSGHRGTFIEADILKLDLQREFDLICVFDCLEHVGISNITKIIEVINRHSHDRTRVLLTIPNPEYLGFLSDAAPNLLQIIDELPPLSEIIASFSRFGFKLRFAREFGINIDAQYYEIVFERRDKLPKGWEKWQK